MTHHLILTDETAEHIEVWRDPKLWRSEDADPGGYFEEFVVNAIAAARLVKVEPVERGPELAVEQPLYVDSYGAVVDAHGEEVEPSDLDEVVRRANVHDDLCRQLDAAYARGAAAEAEVARLRAEYETTCDRCAGAGETQERVPIGMMHGDPQTCSLCHGAGRVGASAEFAFTGAEMRERDMETTA